MNPAEIKIRYRGKFIGGKWMYSTPRTVELPVPYISRSEKEGEVVCNPVGVFPYHYGMKLLELSGENGPFVLEEKLPEANAIPEDIEVGPGSCRVETPENLQTLEPWSQEQIRKRINYARLKRGVRKRKRRSDAGISRPFGAKKASIPDTPQADAVELAPSPE